jgi:hypothetical protein
VAAAPLPVLLTELFVDLYSRLPEVDRPAFDAMIDRLASEHDGSRLRGIFRGDTILFATPRTYAPSAVYRLTWVYDDRRSPTAVVCLTLAEV